MDLAESPLHGVVFLAICITVLVTCREVSLTNCLTASCSQWAPVPTRSKKTGARLKCYVFTDHKLMFRPREEILFSQRRLFFRVIEVGIPSEGPHNIASNDGCNQ